MINPMGSILPSLVHLMFFTMLYSKMPHVLIRHDHIHYAPMCVCVCVCVCVPIKLYIQLDSPFTYDVLKNDIHPTVEFLYGTYSHRFQYCRGQEPSST